MSKKADKRGKMRYLQLKSLSPEPIPMKAKSSLRRVNKKTAMRMAFHSSGLRLTRQRLAIYRELTGRYDHPDVDMLYQAVRKRVPRISLFTVYRTVNALELAGMVWRVATWKGHARYDGAVETHAHFLCETCGRIDDVQGEAAGCPETVIAGLKGTARRVDLMIRGECENCSAAVKTAESAS